MGHCKPQTKYAHSLAESQVLVDHPYFFQATSCHLPYYRAEQRRKKKKRSAYVHLRASNPYKKEKNTYFIISLSLITRLISLTSRALTHTTDFLRPNGNHAVPERKSNQSLFLKKKKKKRKQERHRNILSLRMRKSFR